jgi:hypothetical protein
VPAVPGAAAALITPATSSQPTADGGTTAIITPRPAGPADSGLAAEADTLRQEVDALRQEDDVLDQEVDALLIQDDAQALSIETMISPATQPPTPGAPARRPRVIKWNGDFAPGNDRARR